MAAQLIERADEADRNHPLDRFPDELDRIEVRRVRWQKDKLDGVVVGGLLDLSAVMAAEVVEDDDDGAIRAVSGANRGEELRDRGLVGNAGP
jgi:hypothetical protein